LDLWEDPAWPCHAVAPCMDAAFGNIVQHDVRVLCMSSISPVLRVQHFVPFADGDPLCCLPRAPNCCEFHACSGVYPCWIFRSQFSPEHITKSIEFNSICSMMKHPSIVSFQNVLHGWSPKTLRPNCFNVSQCQQFPYCFFFKFCNPVICNFMYIRQPRDQSDQVHRGPRNILSCISFDQNWHLSAFCVSIRWMNIRPIAQIVPPVILFSVCL
ncbi:hypothetical protein XENOCAPTIV_023359, partial [Xenoophorus captivus]